MNLVVIAAVIAVCGAAKLDRTYLPPASAKTAGGSPGSLQTPFSGNSLNNGLGGLPKGSYENDFQGVVVDAAAAGTRTSETGDTGLGAPRISYGSTNSKVGSAAFKTGPAAFRQPESDGQTSQFQAVGQINERPRASLDRNAGILRLENEVGPENYHFAYETDNGIQAEENGVATNGVQAQGGFSYTGDDGQVYSVSYTADEGGYQPKGAHLPTPPPIPEEILKSLEQNARDEAAGLIDDGSYDAQKYNAGNDYTESDNENGKFTHQSSKFGGFETDATASGTFINQNNQLFKRPGLLQGGSNGYGNQGSSFNGQGLNEQNEQAGFEQSQFGDNTDSNAENVAQTGQANGFSGQFNQAANRPTVQLGQPANRPSASNQGSSFGQASFVSSQGQNNRFGSSASASAAQTGSSSQTNAFGNRNEYLPPVNAPTPNARPQNGRPQNGRPQNGRPQNRPAASTDSQQKDNKDEESPLNIVPLGQQDLQSESRPQEAITSFGQPITSGSATQKFGSSGNKNKNGRRPSATQSNVFAQGQVSQSLNARPNEYLPPVNQNRRPQNRPQGAINGASQFNQQFNGNMQNAEDVAAPEDKPQGSFPSPSSGSQSSFGSQSQQSNGFQRPQASRPGFNGNRFASAQKQPQFGSSSSQSTSTFGSSSRPTSQPDIELTTPLEDDASAASVSQKGSQTPTSSFASASANGRPTQAPFGSQTNRQNGFSSHPQGSNSRPFGQTQSPAFPTQPSFGQFNQNSQFGSQSQSENDDAQFAQSTQRPSFSQQQGPDDSYYYNQPAKPFGTPQGSRFPSAPSNQFASMNQQSFSQNGQFNSQDVPSTAFPSAQPQAIRQPQPPTLGTIVSSAQAQSRFDSQSQGSRFPNAPSNQFASMNQQSFSQNGQFSNSLQNVPSTAFPSVQSQATRQPQPPTLGTIVASSDAQQFGAQSQGFTKYPRPQTFAPSRPTLASQNQFQGSTNGITQASISPFPSQTPTQASQFNTQGPFGSRPNYQQSSQFSQSQTSQASVSSFGQQSTPAPFGQRPQKPVNKFQGQSQTESQDQKEDEGKPVDVPQYTGEIYEYSKPAVTLPPPDSTPSSSAGEEQSQDARPQSGQTSDEEHQRPSSQPQGSRPQFGGQSKPQFGQAQTQNTFGARPMSSTEDSKPYGALAQSFAQQSGPRPQSGQGRPQFSQGFTAQKTEDQMSQFGAQTEPANEESDADSKGPMNQFGFISPCCKETPEFGRKPQPQGFGGQNQFAQSFAGAQGFKPEPTNSFAGKGEEFGGPRQPPSFDEQTGYHY